MPRRGRGGRQKGLAAFAFMAVVLMILGFLMASPQVSPQQAYTYPIPPAHQPPSEEGGGMLGALGNLFQPIAQALGFSASPSPGSETVGLEAEFGITSSTGQGVVFSRNVMSGAYVGWVGMAGVYVKPNLGSYKALKLYDEASPQAEGEIWVRPIVRVRVFNGTPVGYSFKTTVKLVVDGQVVDSTTVEKSGPGSPPMEIRMDKVSVKGKDLHEILRAPKGHAHGVGKGALKKVAYLSGVQPVQGKPVVEGRQICFYVDYEGAVMFQDPVTGEEYPVYRRLENANLGCFDFAIAETGDFEMRIERNVTIAPIAEVLTGGEVGAGGLRTETVTHTITVPVGTEVSVIGGQTTTITKYSTVRVPITETKYVTTIIRTTVTQKEYEYIVMTVTRTVTVSVGGGGGGGGGGGAGAGKYLLTSGVVLVKQPYGAFIFIGRG